MPHRALLALGDRLRSLRLAAGLTQAQLAGDRFSKEYISQIERGKTRPTAESIAWLAEQLGVDSAFLASGVSTDLRGRIEAPLARAEALSEAHRYDRGDRALRVGAADVGATGSAELEVRALSGEAWALHPGGRDQRCVELLLVARGLAEGPQFSDVDRADLLFRLGVCRYKLSSVATAVALFDEALDARRPAPGSPATSCAPTSSAGARAAAGASAISRRRARTSSAALELAQGADDRRVVANTYFQASLVAERMGHWVASRNYAQQAKALYEELNDERNVGRLMLNLGGLHLLLGKPRAGDRPPQGVVCARRRGRSRSRMPPRRSAASPPCTSGSPTTTRPTSTRRKALALLDGREDFLDEIGQSQLVLGRALLERGRLDEADECFVAADAVFEQMASLGHRAGAWIARGDLAVVVVTTTRRHVCIGSLQKRSRTSGSRKEARQCGKVTALLARERGAIHQLDPAVTHCHTWSDGH